MGWRPRGLSPEGGRSGGHSCSVSGVIESVARCGAGGGGASRAGGLGGGGDNKGMGVGVRWEGQTWSRPVESRGEGCVGMG